MQMDTHVRAILFGAALTFSVAAAFADMPAKDTVKGEDPAMLSRFAGAMMVGYNVKAYDEAQLAAGKVPHDAKRVPEKVLTLEGKLTKIAYDFPKDRSSLEVMRNYEAALQKAGFATLFSCAKLTCGEDFGDVMLERVGNNFIQGSSDYWAPFNYSRQSNRYLVARGTRPDGSVVHAAIYVVDPDNQHNGAVLVELVEGKAMETNKVAATLDAQAMAKGIATEGKVAVYGVYFDTDKAEIQPKSKAALDEMAKLLAADPKLKVYIVGHTDSAGDFAHNVELSQRRAEAVAKALATSYKVDAKRLTARGVASLAPVASNDAEAGREKNRRVELVKQ